MLKKCLKNRTFLICSIILVPVFLAAILGDVIAPYDPYTIDGNAVLQGSTWAHPLGTDEFGRDILSRLIVGIRPTIVIAVSATILAFALGILAGVTAGYFGGVSEQLLMRATDMIQCIPPIMLAMTVVAFWGSDIYGLILVIVIVYAPGFARISYSSTILIRKMEFVECDVSLGASSVWIIRKGILPNIISPMIIQASLTIASAILLESGLSFLGLGVLPPTPSWGQMIGDAKGYMSVSPTYVFWPSFFLSVTILSINLLGDCMRDAMDPRLKNTFNGV